MEWVMEDFTKGELQLSWWTAVPNIQKVPLQGSYSVPAESVLVYYCNIKVDKGEIKLVLGRKVFSNIRKKYRR